MSVKGTVYLIHFDKNLCHAQHYIGWSENVEERCKQHKAGTGAKIIAAINELNIGWKVVRVWENQSPMLWP